MAYTFTATKTYTRLVFLKMQIRVVLRQTTNISDATLDQLMIGVDNLWIKTFEIYGFDAQGLCRAQLTLEIDWDEYNHQVSVGKATISTDIKWRNDILIEVEQVIKSFQQFVKDFNLQTDWGISYVDWVWNNSAKLANVRKKLGTSPREPIKWAGNKKGMTFHNEEFRDLLLGLYISG